LVVQHVDAQLALRSAQLREPASLLLICGDDRAEQLTREFPNVAVELFADDVVHGDSNWANTECASRRLGRSSLISDPSDHCRFAGNEQHGVCSQHSGQSFAFRQSRPFDRRPSSVAPQISQLNVPTTGSVGARRELTNQVAICRASSAFVWIGVFIVCRGDTGSNSNPYILSHPSGNLAPAAVCAVSTGESPAARVCGRAMKCGSVEGAATYSFA
jgi:hypothetical protein